MSATLTTVPGADHVGGGRRCRFAVDLATSPNALLRVLTLLRRRGCEIVAVDYRRPDRHGPGRLEVSVEAPDRVSHRLREWLAGLVDVVAVDGP